MTPDRLSDADLDRIVEDQVDTNRYDPHTVTEDMLEDVRALVAEVRKLRAERKRHGCEALTAMGQEMGGYDDPDAPPDLQGLPNERVLRSTAMPGVYLRTWSPPTEGGLREALAARYENGRLVVGVDGQTDTDPGPGGEWVPLDPVPLDTGRWEQNTEATGGWVDWLLKDRDGANGRLTRNPAGWWRAELALKDAEDLEAAARIIRATGGTA